MIYWIISIAIWLLSITIVSTITCLGFELKNKNIKRWKSIVGLIIVQLPFVVVKYIFSYTVLVSVLSLFLLVGVCTIYLMIFYEGTLWQKVLFVVYTALCGCMSEWLVLILFQDALRQVENLSFQSPIMFLNISCIQIVNALLLLLWLCVWRKLIYKKGYDYKIYIIFCIFPISQIVMMGNLGENLQELTPGGIGAAISILISMIADVVLLIVLQRQQRIHGMAIRLNETEKAWELEQNHYRDIEARREELAKIRHDLSEQFVVIQELLHQEKYEKAMEMLSTLEEYVAQTKEYVYCQDPIVNAIMAENEKNCRKNGVSFIYNLEIMKPLNINPVAICSIFSNLMRNAIAAVEAIEDKTNTYIFIKAMVKGDYLYVEVDNPFSSNKKKNEKRKGYGLDILKSLVDKYHGEMKNVTEDGIYSTKIMIENVIDT